MDYSLIESYDQDETQVYDGRTYPATCLLEDEDGIRFLLFQGPISLNTWQRASMSGAAYLVTVNNTGWFAITANSFMENRTEERGLLEPLGTALSAHDDVPTYLDVVRAQRAPEAAPEGSVTGFVNLHTHSEYSTLDGLSTMAEIMTTVTALGQGAVAVTDHSHCAGHADLMVTATKAGIRPIFGMEANFVEDRHRRSDDFVYVPDPSLSGPDQKAREREHRAAFVKEVGDYYHLVLWAKDEAGLRNLWAMSSEGYHDGFHGRPRIDWDTLAKHHEGVIASTACLRGPLAHNALMNNDEPLARERLARLHGIFGDDLYVEIHCNQLTEQIMLNKDLVRIAREFRIPLVAGVDSHYSVEEHSKAHRVWLSVQTNKDIGDDTDLFSGQQKYHLMGEAEVRESLYYLPQDVVDEAVGNTTAIANQCTATIHGTTTMPVFSKKGGHARDAERLREMCESNWYLVEGKPEVGDETYRERFEREIAMLIRKNYCGYYLFNAVMTNYAHENHILVGPGRGSGGGSLVAYLSRIVSTDPIEAGLMFERFLTEGRDSPPDFDIDYPQSKKRQMQDFARKEFGEDYVTVVGSILRLKSKGIVKDLQRAMASTLPEGSFVDLKDFSKVVEDAEADSAGLGISWEDLWDRHGDELAPFRSRYPELFEMADTLVGRVKTFGQHAAGMVIVSDAPLTGRLPLRRATEEGHMIAQFDKDALEDLGFPKFDMLTLRNLDTIQMALDLIRERRGHDIDIYSWREEYEDPQVWEEIAAAKTLGIFQIETNSGTALVKKMRPKTMLELADTITLVRPGPKNSGLTATYLRRRDGEEEVTYPDPRLEKVLKDTFGAMIYQEQIMAACMLLAGYDTTEADSVRSILGKKKVEKVAAAGDEFVRRAVEWGEMEESDALFLWGQMAEFAKYSFNKSHAYAYAVLGYWCAWLKFHYPVEFLTAALSTVDDSRIADFVKEARKMGISVLGPDINKSGVGFKAVTNLEVRYGLDALKGMGEAAVNGIVPGQPYSSFEDYEERKGQAVDSGKTMILAKVGAFDSIYENRRALETMLLERKEGLDVQCVSKRMDVIGPNGLPCVFDWDNEPLPVNPKTGKTLKQKPIPKKCTKACRNYAPRPAKDFSAIEPYTDEDIRDIEQDLLGIYLSSTPFVRFRDEERELLKEQAERADTGPTGYYTIGGVVTRINKRKDKQERDFAFIDFMTEANDISAVCFSSRWDSFKHDIKMGVLSVIEVEKTGRGFTLIDFIPVR